MLLWSFHEDTVTRPEAHTRLWIFSAFLFFQSNEEASTSMTSLIKDIFYKYTYNKINSLQWKDRKESHSNPSCLYMSTGCMSGSTPDFDQVTWKTFRFLHSLTIPALMSIICPQTKTTTKSGIDEEDELSSRVKPESIGTLCKRSLFTRKELQFMYRCFKQVRRRLGVTLCANIVWQIWFDWCFVSLSPTSFYSMR